MISHFYRMLEEVTGFEDLGATMCKDDTCSTEIRIRIVSAMAGMAMRVKQDLAKQNRQLH